MDKACLIQNCEESLRCKEEGTVSAGTYRPEPHVTVLHFLLHADPRGGSLICSFPKHGTQGCTPALAPWSATNAQ